MYCCDSCFRDFFLKKEVQKEKKIGKCDFCNSTNVSITLANNLDRFFLPVCDLYEMFSTGKFLWDQLQEDWNAFSDQCKKDELIKNILGDDSGIDLSCAYSSIAPKLKQRGTVNHNNWKVFSEEIKWKNRFGVLSLKDFQETLKLLEIDVKKSDVYFRARLNDLNNVFSPDKMGAPPKDVVGNGRANPVGIPYLYLADTKDTAVAEVRPSLGQYVSMGQFSIQKDIRIIDLVEISPFQLSLIEELLPQIFFLRSLGDELSKPVLPAACHIEYLPTQYLCEFIKRCGWDGVRFKSSQFTSLGNVGINLILFDPNNAQCEGVALVQATSIKYIHNEIASV